MYIKDTIAVTQNYCSHANFEAVWRKTRTGRKKMAVKWFNLLKTEYPHLADEAEKINKLDEFVFPIPVESSNKKKQKKEKK